MYKKIIKFIVLLALKIEKLHIRLKHTSAYAYLTQSLIIQMRNPNFRDCVI